MLSRNYNNEVAAHYSRDNSASLVKNPGLVVGTGAAEAAAMWQCQQFEIKSHL
jgi:hypothetical protein